MVYGVLKGHPLLVVEAGHVRGHQHVVVAHEREDRTVASDDAVIYVGGHCVLIEGE